MSRKRWAVVILVAVLLAGGVGGWWWFRHRTAPVEPPMPGDIHDAEVRLVLERARQDVLNAPGSAADWGRLGMMLLAHLFDREADRCFVEAARLDPTDPRWPYARGLIALKRDPDRAVPLLREAAARSDSSPEYRTSIRMQLAEALMERGELNEAEKLFRDEKQRTPGNQRADLGLGLIALARGKDRAAADLLSAARTSPHARKTATAQLAALARRRGDETAAREFQTQTAELPDDAPWPDPLLDETMRMRVGHRSRERELAHLEKQHRYRDAADIYLEQLRTEPTARAAVGAGINLARLGDYDRALPLLRQGVKLDPDSAHAHYSLALTLFTRAEKRWQKEPGSPQAKEWFRAATGPARRAAELKPDHAYAYLYWGLALKHLGEPAAAVAPLRKGVACRPEDFELQLALGEALLDAGQHQEAKTHLENARRLDPKDQRPSRALERLRKKG